MMNKNYLTMAEREAQLNDLLLAKKEDFSLKYKKVTKNNGLELEGYLLVSEKYNCSPIVYLGDWYEQNDEEVVSYLTDYFKRTCRNIDVSSILNRDYILGHVYPRLVSDVNIDEVKRQEYVSIRFLDMLILFHFEMKLDGIEGSETVILREIMLDRLDISFSELYSRAFDNLEKDVSIRNIYTVTMEMLNDEKLDDEYLDLSGEPLVYVCTNSSQLYGAATLLCKSVQNRLVQMFGNKIALLPSSIHEFLVTPYEQDWEISNYRKMVKEINRTVLDADEVLTDNVYLLENGKITIAG